MNLLSLVDQLREWLVTFNQHGSMSGNPDQSRVDAYEHAWNSIEALCGIADKLEGLVEAPELFEQLVVERWSIYHALPTLQKISNTGMIDTTTTAENNREVMVLLCKALVHPSGLQKILDTVYSFESLSGNQATLKAVADSLNDYFGDVGILEGVPKPYFEVPVTSQEIEALNTIKTGFLTQSVFDVQNLPVFLALSILMHPDLIEILNDLINGYFLSLREHRAFSVENLKDGNKNDQTLSQRAPIDNITGMEWLEEFLIQTQTGSLRTKHFPKRMEDLELRVSFGQGALSKVPWVALLAENQTVRKGIYPVYLYYKVWDILICAYGISETESPDLMWDVARLTPISTNKPMLILDYVSQVLGKTDKDIKEVQSHRLNGYIDSYVYAAYKVNFAKGIEVIEISKDESQSFDDLGKDLQSIIEEYRSILSPRTSPIAAPAKTPDAAPPLTPNNSISARGIISPEGSDDLSEIAALRDSGNIDRALEKLQQAISQKHQAQTNYSSDLAHYYQYQGDLILDKHEQAHSMLNEALESYQKSIDYEPSVEGLLGLSDIHLSLNEFDECGDYLYRSIELCGKVKLDFINLLYRHKNHKKLGITPNRVELLKTSTENNASDSMVVACSVIMDMKLIESDILEESLTNCISWVERAISAAGDDNISCILNDRLARLYLRLCSDNYRDYADIIGPAQKAKEMAVNLGLAEYPYIHLLNTKWQSESTALTDLESLFQKTETFLQSK
tara:strand:- start:3183 stop:5390 length:2208 start_codon:yes stop_codon:yes gene_type:complete